MLSNDFSVHFVFAFAEGGPNHWAFGAVMSYSVSFKDARNRTRMALGATLSDVSALMIREAIVPVGIGF